MLERIYQITKAGVPYESAWNMPIAVREWWINRVNKDVEEQKQKAANEPKQSSGPPPWARKPGGP